MTSSTEFLSNFRIRPLAEPDIDQVIEEAGGSRAHPDADRREQVGADYLLGNCVIELKALDDDGLAKPERQAKLAALFRPFYPGRPVVVLDRESLPINGKRDFDRILEGPIKTAVSKAKKQLKQSRLEHESATTSIIWFINNGYTALDHDALAKLAAHRVRNDTNEVDGIIVSGCYFHSDSFDSFFLWPFEYIPINLNKPFPHEEKLLQAWNNLSDQHMTALMQQPPGKQDIKGPVIDTQFDIANVTYVKPAPPIGKESDFFRHGRPRKNSTKIIKSPPVGLVFGDLSVEEWTNFQRNLPDAGWLGDTYENWIMERAIASKQASDRSIFIPIQVTWSEWIKWANQTEIYISTTHEYATEVFQGKIKDLIDNAKDIGFASILPSRYMLIITEEIGQDRGNDISHAAIVTTRPNGRQDVEDVFINQRLFHEYAMTLGCAHAIAKGVDVIRWRKDKKYSWF
ncbi:hypothetical protein CEK69_03170 [Xanthomonas sp. LMG 12462]|uniref:hypothetical protein n=1 Tax=Xanthomonas sp. LMG 12462 TaxID=1591134 RepID=UPI0012650B4E|nr:hypothetical protein [Xanthomonas sp. LMG 12462]KAB7773720.1 hypothetical protein CEK69_03170 [Xanthomonas sp. LMG 12462]